jgi:Phage integrase family
MVRWPVTFADPQRLARPRRARGVPSESRPRSSDRSAGRVARAAPEVRLEPERERDDLVFCHPQRGTGYRVERFKDALDTALSAAEVDGYVRPFHDLRHTAITNDAASGSNPIAVMTKAGHSDMKTTKTYMHLAGVVFRDEADALEQPLLGASTDPAHEADAVGSYPSPDGTQQSQNIGRGAGSADTATGLDGRGQLDGSIDERQRPGLCVVEHSLMVSAGVESSTHLSASEPTSARNEPFNHAGNI